VKRRCRDRSIRDVADLEGVQWPPDPIETKRLLVRPTEAQDRDGCIELLCSEEVRRYLGGPLSRDDVEGAMPEGPGNYPGVFAVEADGEFIGNVTLDRRDPDRPGHLRAQGNEVEVSYTLLPARWGNGYGTEAVAAVLQWVERALPGEPVVLCTQSTNDASMRLAARLGFVEKERFVEFDAEQWFGVRIPQADTP
jgi:RimJ/RimL family protein N-acetyltransferase